MEGAPQAPAALAREVEALIESQIRPLLRIHGGDIELLEASEEGRLRLAFQGACRGCALKAVTYALGVRQRLLQHPGVREVEVEGVRLPPAALRRVERAYAGCSFWPGGGEAPSGKDPTEESQP